MTSFPSDIFVYIFLNPQFVSFLQLRDGVGGEFEGYPGDCTRSCVRLKKNTPSRKSSASDLAPSEGQTTQAGGSNDMEVEGRYCCKSNSTLLLLLTFHYLIW